MRFALAVIFKYFYSIFRQILDEVYCMSGYHDLEVFFQNLLK
ncbi:hypothetical protein O204_22485 [Pseudomonas simiae]|uniref:Uncharacterized protein n=1 Tax=Pseudomonas simiae TaxID=321846 RepID=U1UXF5_9PSED|nr:hypothetical protein O204_22485 [Pseudomonas simiae]